MLVQVLYLENCSDVPLEFQFLTEPAGVFTVTKSHGTIPPHSLEHTAVCFRGTLPTNYWQRILCLVKVNRKLAVHFGSR